MNAPQLVRDAMRPPVLAPEGMWFRELVRLQRDCDTEFVMVVDGRGRAVGAVTEEDLLLKLARRWAERPPALPESSSRRAERLKAVAVTARELMTEPLISIAATDPLTTAASLMRRRHVRHLAVVDGSGRPVGAIDRHDLLRLLLRSDEEVRQDVEDLLARTLRGQAGAVGVEVSDGVVVLEPLGDVDLGDMHGDLLDIQGVLAVRIERGLVGSHGSHER